MKASFVPGKKGHVARTWLNFETELIIDCALSNLFVFVQLQKIQSLLPKCKAPIGAGILIITQETSMEKHQWSTCQTQMSKSKFGSSCSQALNSQETQRYRSKKSPRSTPSLWESSLPKTRHSIETSQVFAMSGVSKVRTHEEDRKAKVHSSSWYVAGFFLPLPTFCFYHQEQMPPRPTQDLRHTCHKMSEKHFALSIASSILQKLEPEKLAVEDCQK